MRETAVPAAGPLAWSVWALVFALNGLGVALLAADSSLAAAAVVRVVANQAFATFGALIASRRPAHRIGWLYLGTGLVLTVSLVAYAYALYAHGGPGRPLPMGAVAAWAAAWLAPLCFAAAAFGFLLFPDGRLPSPRWRVFAWGYAAVVVLSVVVVAVTPGGLFGVAGVPNPYGLELALLQEARPLLLRLVLLSAAGGLLVSVLSLVPRFRRAGAVERQQLKWLLFPAVVLGLSWTLVGGAAVLGAAWAVEVFILVGTAAIVGIPVGGGIAILKHRLFDIDLVIRRSVVYGIVWLVIGVTYLALAGALGIVAGHRLPVQLAIAVTIAATLLFQPLRRQVDQLARRRVLGERLTGYELVRRFGETLEHAYDVAELAPRITAAVRDGLEVRWARLSLRLHAGDGWLLEPAGAAGIGLDEHADAEATVALVHAGQELGVLECGPKRDGRLTGDDLELLEALARQAALGIHNARLAAELAARLDELRRQAQETRASRTRIVHAQDAERRRIERYLHDGVQQEIVALKARVRLARNELPRDPEAADGMLAAIQGEVGRIIENLRELAHGIHPPVLTDRGLVAAIEARASTLPIGVRIQATAETRAARFAEDVEGAAYFFVSEALTNVLKHARTEAALVRVAVGGGRLQVEVSDQGTGFVAADTQGFGLGGLRDRIEAVGGGFALNSRPGEGTTVTADLPARAAVASDA